METQFQVESDRLLLSADDEFSRLFSGIQSLLRY